MENIAITANYRVTGKKNASKESEKTNPVVTLKAIS